MANYFPIFFLFFTHLLFSQVDPDELLEIEGAIQIGNSAETYADPGTIRWTGSDYEVWKDDHWISLTGVSFIRDIDNHRYEMIDIGDQVWMAENLKVTRFNDGTPIDLVTDGALWLAHSAPAYTWYNNSSSPYGALYNFHVVESAKNVCPLGWHVPTSSEWDVLASFLGGSAVAGGKLKETGLAHWLNTHPEVTNTSGFSALPGGLRFTAFDDYGTAGHFWTSSLSVHGGAISRMVLSGSEQLYYRSDFSKNYGISIRCLRD